LNGLYYAHSGLRYLILVVGIIVVVYSLSAVLGKRPHDRRLAGLAAAFAGLIHLQIMLGMGLIFAGRFYPAVWGHFMAMLLAAVLAQLPASVNRRRPEAERTVMPHLIGAVLALLAIAGGIMAIGRVPWGSAAL
jgi:hypothetical protein